jgi:hypothetical protein
MAPGLSGVAPSHGFSNKHFQTGFSHTGQKSKGSLKIEGLVTFVNVSKHLGLRPATDGHKHSKLQTCMVDLK